MENMDARLFRRESVNYGPGSVGRVVVDEEKLDVVLKHRLGHRANVVLLVVCRYDNYCLHVTWFKGFCRLIFILPSLFTNLNHSQLP